MRREAEERVDPKPVPRVWLLLGEKAGDNVQVTSLAQSLPWPCVEKRVVPLPIWRTRKPRLTPSIDHLDLGLSDPLEGPWPDLIVTVGRVPSRAALWVKAQTGGVCRVVVIGKPRGMIDAFDLIVAASHYVVSSRTNVLKHDFPLMFTQQAALDEARGGWASRFDALPRPIVALMIGGSTRSLRLDTKTARRIYEQTRAESERRGGSVFVTTSRRTSEEVVALLRDECGDPRRFFAFAADSRPEDNPYQGLLALADHFVVTLDSLSMIVDVARLGGGLSIAPLSRRTHPIEEALIRLRCLRRLDPRRDPIPTGGFESRVMMRLGRPVHVRDMSAVPRLLVERGQAGWLGDDWTEPAGDVTDERAEIAWRVRELIEAAGSPWSKEDSARPARDILVRGSIGD